MFCFTCTTTLCRESKLSAHFTGLFGASSHGGAFLIISRNSGAGKRGLSELESRVLYTLRLFVFPLVFFFCCILGSKSCFNVVGKELYIQGFALAQSLAKVLFIIGGEVIRGVNKCFGRARMMVQSIYIYITYIYTFTYIVMSGFLFFFLFLFFFV